MFGRILARKDYLLEMFVISNIGFLAIDILIAHSINDFAHAAEWIPVIFSIFVPLILAANLYRYITDKKPLENEKLGFFLGVLSIIIGLLGMYFHLKSQFFFKFTAKSLVYSAPFIAPLFYAGMGLLLILNRKISVKNNSWGQEVVVLAVVGFLSNYILSLLDHEQSGFYRPIEWIPVISATIGAAFLIPVRFFSLSEQFYKMLLVIMGIQIIVGVIGFILHFIAILYGPSIYFSRNFLHGAPPFAPLLFVDVALLAMLGLYQIKVSGNGVTQPQ